MSEYVCGDRYFDSVARRKSEYVQTCQVFNPLIKILSSNVVNLFAKEDEDQEDEEEEEEEEEQREEEEEEDYFEEVRSPVRCSA